jgi:hypothetical protein
MHGAAYTAEDIKRYLRGELSPAEMHALEKAALDDPFLADAIEGIETIGVNFDEDVAKLSEKINRRSGKKTAVGIYWKLAAVLLVLITAVTIVLLMDNKQPESKERVLAKVESKRETPVVKQEKQKPEILEPQEGKEDKTGVTVSPVLSAQEQTIKKEEEVALISQSEKAISIADSVQLPAARRDSDLQLKKLQGKVAGVQVNKDERQDEVVVMGYSAKKKQRLTRNNESIVPEGGWESFYQYLNDYMSTADSLRKGVEIISFTIDKNNRPQNFRIRKSISPAHDAEAIRLLENGPDWKIIKGTKRKLKLEIEF